MCMHACVQAPKAASADECCALCVADPAHCWAATLYEGVCYFKPKGGKENSGVSRYIAANPCILVYTSWIHGLHRG